jgi:hypothetical protein
MAAGNVSELFRLGAAVLKTTVDTVTNTILAQLGSIADEYVYADDADWYQHVGFASRPSQPVKNKSAAECVSIIGDREVVIASRDLRGLAIYGNMNDGETCVYAGGSDGNAQARVYCRADGSVTLMTTDTNTGPDKGGQVVALRISPQGGLEFTSQWGSMVLDKTGFHVKTAAGPRIDMGGLTIPGLSAIPGIGTLVNSMGSYATISAPFVNIQGAAVSLGMGPIFNAATAAMPSAVPPLPANTPASVANIGAITSSGTVWVSQ